jgi:hypothetical protein
MATQSTTFNLTSSPQCGASILTLLNLLCIWHLMYSKCQTIHHSNLQLTLIPMLCVNHLSLLSIVTLYLTFHVLLRPHNPSDYIKFYSQHPVWSINTYSPQLLCIWHFMYSNGHTIHQTTLNITLNTPCGASILTLHSYSVFDISCTLMATQSTMLKWQQCQMLRMVQWKAF